MYSKSDVDQAEMCGAIGHSGRASLVIMSLGIGVGMISLGQYGLEMFITGLALFITTIITVRRWNEIIVKSVSDDYGLNFECVDCDCDGSYCDTCHGLGRLSRRDLTRVLSPIVEVTDDLLEGYRIPKGLDSWT